MNSRENDASAVSDDRSARRARVAHVPAVSVGSQATGAQAIGAFALAAVAIGALAIGALAIGRLTIGRARIRRLEIDDLVVRRVSFIEQLKTPSDDRPEKNR
jgi:hypothetical protein